MAQKSKSVYICENCGYEAPKWSGQCPSCGEWNTMQEGISVAAAPSKSPSAAKPSSDARAMKLSEISSTGEHRYKTGFSELDRVLGGGIVKGAVMLISGDPGIGKSTIMLQICQKLSELNVLYVSGEESSRQIKLRANRLGVTGDNLSVMCSTDVLSIVDYINRNRPDAVIIDSIQTMNLSQLNSSPGSVPQIRESTNAFFHTDKENDIPFFIVGHVNKDGAIAGPKVLEHIVDAVLYFEGERNLSYRILRAVKNRFGSTNEIGVFEMTEDGLCQVENPSSMLLSGRPKNAAGTCVACAIEGTRPILAEVQALVSSTNFGNPRRMSTGFDYNRMNVLLAVLEKRAGYFFSNLDAYVNIVGGLKIDEPAADLTVAMALVSSLKDLVIPDKLLCFGEIGLAGEIRGVSRASERINEAARLGFDCCIIPYSNKKNLTYIPEGMTVIGVNSVRKAVEAVADRI